MDTSTEQRHNDIKVEENWGGKYSFNLNAIWHEDNFTSASGEIKKLIAQANQVFLSLEKLSEDSDLSSFKGDFVAQIEKTKKEMNDIIESAGNNFLEFALRDIPKRVREHKFAAQTTTASLLKKCLNCDTHSKEFNEEFIDTDVYLYKCPNCGETYDGAELSEEM